MKKMKTKGLAVILAIICLVPMLSICSSAKIYSGNIGVSTKWTLDTETGHLQVEGTPGGTSDYFDHYTSPWREHYQYIKTAEVIGEVEVIGKYAFQGLTHLESIKLPEGIKRIRINAFDRCTALKSIEIPATVEIIAQKAFQECNSLETVVLPASLRVMYSAAFNDCENLKTMTVPEYCSQLSSSCISGCTALENAIIPRYADIAAVEMFSDSENLKNIYFEGTEEQWNEKISQLDSTAWIQRLIVHFNYDMNRTAEIIANEVDVLKFGDKLKLNTEIADNVDVASIEWKAVEWDEPRWEYKETDAVILKVSEDSKSCDAISNGSGVMDVSVIVTDTDGKQYVDRIRFEVASNFWMKFVSFFKNLFGINRYV